MHSESCVMNEEQVTTLYTNISWVIQINDDPFPLLGSRDSQPNF